MSLTFIHCSDLHLGRQRLGGKLPESDLADALKYIVRYTLANNAAGLLIAGDLFDSPVIQPAQLQNAIDCLAPLKEKAVPVFAIEGNHDRPSFSSEASTWVRYLNDLGYLHLLSIPFNAEGPVISQWDPVLRRGSYLDYRGIRIIGAGYLGAGTIRRMKAITNRLAELTAGKTRIPTIMLLHAGPEYLVHEGGGYNQESLDFLHEYVDYLALGHIHKPLNYGGWAANPGTAADIRLEEACYGHKTGTEVSRGMIKLEIEPDSLFTLPTVTPVNVPRRPVVAINFDCSPYLKKRNAKDELLAKLVETLKQAAIAPESVLRVELQGELNLEKLELDTLALANFLEEQLPVLAAEISISSLGSMAETGNGCPDHLTELPRELIEKQAIGILLGQSNLGNLEDQQAALVELFLELKEDVRNRASSQEILDKLARHSVVRKLAAAITKDRLASPQAEVAATESGGEPL